MNLQNTKRLTDLEDNLWLPIHTAVFKMDHQHGPTVQHKERCSMLCGSWDGRGVWEELGTCIFMSSPFPVQLNSHNVVNRLHSNTKKQVRKIHKITLLPCTHDHSTTPHALMEFI